MTDTHPYQRTNAKMTANRRRKEPYGVDDEQHSPLPQRASYPLHTLNWCNRNPNLTAARILMVATKCQNSKVCESEINHPLQ
jgi:hypothetical protein